MKIFWEKENFYFLNKFIKGPLNSLKLTIRIISPSSERGAGNYRSYFSIFFRAYNESMTLGYFSGIDF